MNKRNQSRKGLMLFCRTPIQFPEVCARCGVETGDTIAVKIRQAGFEADGIARSCGSSNRGCARVAFWFDQDSVLPAMPPVFPHWPTDESGFPDMRTHNLFPRW